MPIDTSILGGITLPQLRDPQQEAINQLNMRSMQLNQQKLAMDMRQQEQKDKDLSLLDQIMSQLPKDASGYIDPDKAQELVPGRLRPIVANAVKEINEAKINVEQTKKKLVQDLAEGVYQARFDPQAQSQMFLGKLAAMRDANLVSDADAKDMLRLVTRPSAPGADPNTGGINTDALNAVVAGLMGSERMKAIQNAEGQNRIVVGKSLVDRNTGKVIFAEPEEPKPAPQPTTAGLSSKYIDILAKGNLATAQEQAWASAYTKEANLGRGVSSTAKATLTPNAESALISRLNKEWETASKTPSELKRQMILMDEGLKAAKENNLAQGGQVILTVFQKILDPTSVVRESEFNRSREAQSLVQRAEAALERLQKGGAGVPLKELEKYVELARNITDAVNNYVASKQDRIGRVADRYNIPRELVFENSALPVKPQTVSDYIKKYGGG